MTALCFGCCRPAPLVEAASGKTVVFHSTDRPLTPTRMTNNESNKQPSGPFQGPVSPERLQEELAQFTGTAAYHCYGLGLTYLTDGVRHLAERASCFWLLDAIGSYQKELASHTDERLQEMQFWHLQVNEDETALLTCVADAGEPPAIKQKIQWTDFPLPEIDIWVAVDGTKRIALLPSEY